jgi:4-amino-4-deoxy-L-arabinose transferase-like glycosyltransferase
MARAPLRSFNIFWRLTITTVSDYDEARYGVAASEMLRSHSLLVATYAGQTEYWNLKPPLGYWLLELSFRLFGPTLLALRLPSALAALAVVGATMRICRRWQNRRAALLAGLIMATCFGFLSHHGARSGDLDAMLTLIVLVGAAQIPDLDHSQRSRLMWAVMIAAGFLLKSFAILPLLIISAAHLWLRGALPRQKLADWLPPAALIILSIGGWILARSHADGSIYFVMRMFREDLFARSTSIIDNNRSMPWDYVGILFDRMAPWPMIALLSWFFADRFHSHYQSRHTQLLWLWALVPLAMFSAARTHHHWYMDPSYPPWAMIAAAGCLTLIRCMSLPWPRQLTAGLVVLGLLACEARIALRVNRDALIHSQLYLMSIKRAPVVPSQSVCALFALSHSERFILEVVDRLEVEENSRVSAQSCNRLKNEILLSRNPSSEFNSDATSYSFKEH